MYSLSQQIEFVRGARHLVSKKNTVVVLSAEHHQLLHEIENNLNRITTIQDTEKIKDTKDGKN